MKKLVTHFLLSLMLGIISLAQLAATDVSGNITVDETWDLAGSPYVIQANVNILNGVTVTVESGVLVEFTENTSMYVYGTLNATGAVFTAAVEGTKGYWRTIQVGKNADAGTAVFDGCEIRYGGYSSNPANYGNVYAYNGTVTLKNNSQVINSKNHGIMVHAGGVVSLANTTVSSCDWPICYVNPGQVEFLGGNTLTGNTHDAIRMAYTYQTNDLYLDTVNIPYVFPSTNTVNNGKTLEIASGNILKLSNDLVIEGTLLAEAGAGENIWFTSTKDDNLGGDTNDDGTATAPAPRSWGSIRFKSNSSPLSIMRRCIVSFGGSGGISGVSGISGIGGITMQHASPTIEYCEMYNNYIGAVFQGVSEPVFRFNTIGSSVLVPLAMSFEANPEFEDNVFSFSDNEYDAIGLLHGTLSADATLIQRHVTTINNVTYMLLGTITIPEPHTLTVEDSIVIKGFQSSHRIIVKGTLILDGTADDGEIVITSAKDDNHGNPMDSNKDGTQSTPSIGDWGGIVFEGTSDDDHCKLAHVLLKYGSMPSVYYNTRYISQGLVTTVNASPVIENCTLKDMHYGLYAFQASDPTVTNTEFTNSSKTPIALSVSADPVMSGLTFVNTSWTALGIIGEKVGFDGTVKVRNVAGYDNITYLLLEDLTINSGTHVDVEPSVVIKCAQNAGIFVEGGFQAVGTASDTIVFTSVADDNHGNPGDTRNDGDADAPDPGDWETIQYKSTADDVYDSITYCKILYAGYYNKGSLIFTDAGGNVTHTLISDGDYYGIMCEGTANPTCTDGVEIKNCEEDPLAMSLKSDPDFDFAGMTLESNGNGSNGIRILEGTLSSDATLRTRNVAGIYNIAYIVDQLTISSGATLTIMPGVVIKFLHYYSRITVDGALVADSDPPVKGPGESIVFTSLKDDSKGGDTNDDGNESSPQRGDWWCIVFNSSDLDHLNVLNQCLIHYGARDQSGWTNRKDFGAVRVFDASVMVTECEIEHCHTSALGIFGSADPSVTGNQINNVNQTPVTMSMFSNPVFSGNSASNLGINALGIAQESFSLDATVPLRDFGGYDTITYYLYRPLKVNSGTILTIPAGAIFKYNWNIDCFDVDGGLLVKGTADAPVVFTHEYDDDYGRPRDTNGDGDDSEPGIQTNSYCLDFADISDDTSSVDYAVFRYKHAGIILRQASPSIDHSEFKYNHYGMILNGVSTPEVTNNLFDELVYSPMNISLVSYPSSLSGNQISGSTYRAIGIISEELVQDVTLVNHTFAGIDSIPYFFSGDYSIGTSVVLTIEPGVIMKFQPNAGLTVKRGLMAIGGASSDSLIVFTSILDDFYGGDTNADSTDTSPGGYYENWDGIHFQDQSLDALCRLRHCVIKYAGWHSSEAAITTSAASPEIIQSLISENSNGVRAEGASSPRLDSCDIYNNTYFGVNNVNQSFDISALYCWWGTNNGPTHIDNPSGDGDEISDRVLWSPFRETPMNPMMGDVSLNGTIQAYDASLILRHLITPFLDDVQLRVADVSSNGSVTALDASRILMLVSGIIQDFDEAKKSKPALARLLMEDARVNAGDVFTVDLQAERLSGITALEIGLAYDPEVIQIQDFEVSETLKAYLSEQSIDHAAGSVRFVLAGIQSLPEHLSLGTLKCRVDPETTGSTLTRIEVVRFMVNEDEVTGNSRGTEIQVNMATGLDNPSRVIGFGFGRIYPNPFHARLMIEYHVVEKTEPVRLEVFDQTGRKIKTLVNQQMSPGKYHLEWNPGRMDEGIPEGLYLLRLRSGTTQYIKKIMYRK